MGVGVKPFCLGLAKTLLSGLNKANSTFVAATSDYCGKFEPLVKSPKMIIFHVWDTIWSSQKVKMRLRGKSCPKIQDVIWVLGSNPFV